jgi:salicylate hydroxylase
MEHQRVSECHRDLAVNTAICGGQYGSSVVIQMDVEDRPVRPPWGRGRVVLVGDAAHPVTPALGQGVNMSFEDAAVLADALATHSDVSTAILAYERTRMKRTAAAVAMSRRIGQIATMASSLGC